MCRGSLAAAVAAALLRSVRIAERGRLSTPASRRRTARRCRRGRVVEQELAAEIEVTGGYAKPDWRNLFVIQLAVFPYTLCKVGGNAHRNKEAREAAPRRAARRSASLEARRPSERMGLPDVACCR
eukprot:scaffold5539_cov302-Prasinococcus_capsulatus_cf.AAC.2